MTVERQKRAREKVVPMFYVVKICIQERRPQKHEILGRKDNKGLWVKSFKEATSFLSNQKYSRINVTSDWLFEMRGFKQLAY